MRRCPGSPRLKDAAQRCGLLPGGEFPPGPDALHETTDQESPGQIAAARRAGERMLTRAVNPGDQAYLTVTHGWACRWSEHVSRKLRSFLSRGHDQAAGPLPVL